MMNDLTNFMADHWLVVSGNPVTFVSFALLITMAVTYMNKWHYSGQITTMQRQIDLRNDRIAEYERKLKVSSPQEALSKIEGLEKRLAAIEPLSLSEEKFKNLISALCHSPGKVILTHDGASSQTKKLHGQLLSAFQTAGWTCKTGSVLGIGDPPRSGIRICAAIENSGAGRIQAALIAVGLNSDRGKLKSIFDKDEIEILITDPR